MAWPIILSLISGLIFLFLQLLKRPAPLWKFNGMGSHGPGSRKLGTFEKRAAYFGEHGHNQCALVLLYCSKLPLTENIMRQAVTALAMKHPPLGMRLGRENGVFTYMKEMNDFAIDLEVYNNSDWKQIVEQELLDVIDAEKGPLWRMRFLPNALYHHENQSNCLYHSVCMISTHHVIIDGISGYKLHNDFLNILNEILAGKKLASQSVPLLPPIEAYLESTWKYSFINLRSNLLGIAYAIPTFKNILEKLIKPKPPLFMKEFDDEIKRNFKAPLKTCIMPFELTSEQTSNLIASCKMHKVTVTAVVQTACCIAYCSLADGGQMAKPHKVDVILNYSLLDASMPASLTESLGLFVSAMAIENKLHPDTSGTLQEN